MGILRTDKISGLETPTPVTGSVYFDGTGDELSINAFTGLEMDSGNFTIEMWLYVPTYPNNYKRVFSFGAASITGNSTQALIFEITNTNKMSAISVSGSTLYNITDSVEIKESQWIHWAYVRDKSTLSLYRDGISVGTSDISTNSINFNSSWVLTIGDWNGGTLRPLDGYISNLRILKGTALYTSDFTPPVHELEVIGDTVLLCCNNPDSAGAEGTGKSITVNNDAAASTFSPGLTRDFTSGTEFKGVTTFDTQGYFVPPSGTTEQRGRGRGIFSAGTSPNDNTSTNNIDYITIATSGNVQDFGDLDESRQATSGGSDSTRGLFSGGSSTVSPSGNRNTISYITIAATGNAVNFGDLSGLKRYTGSTSDKTRTVIAGGANAPGPLTDIIEYVTTQSLGDVTTFGDLISATWAFVGTASSPTRGIYFGGSTSTSSSDSVNTIVYVTIQTLGDALDFGDLTNVNAYTGPGGIVSSTTRGIRGGGGGANPFARVNTIDYVTMASTGNAQDFGDLSYAPNGAMGCSSLTRGIFAGGKNSSGSFNTIDYVTIASTGNAQDFGDMRGTYGFGSALSDCHGGIS